MVESKVKTKKKRKNKQFIPKIKKEVEDNFSEEEQIRKKPKYSPTYPYNDNYAYLFNREMNEFFTSDESNDLKDGYITINGSFEAEKDVENTSINGSFWTSQEKNGFFKLLARKSRHNLISIASELGSKSIIEVEEYHDLLFNASKDQPLLDLIEIPAAKEMSEDWINMENEQAKLIEIYEEENVLEEVLDVEENMSEGNLEVQDNISEGVERRGGTGRVENTHEIQDNITEIRDDSSDGTSSTDINQLINRQSLVDLSQSIYPLEIQDKEQYLPPNENSQYLPPNGNIQLIPSISKSCQIELQQHVKDIVIYVMKSAYLTRLQQTRDTLGTVFSQQHKARNRKAMRSIDDEDILRACIKAGVIRSSIETLMNGKESELSGETSESLDQPINDELNLDISVNNSSNDPVSSELSSDIESDVESTSSEDSTNMSNESNMSTENSSIPEEEIEKAITDETEFVDDYDVKHSLKTEQTMTEFIKTGDISLLEKLDNYQPDSSDLFSKISTIPISVLTQKSPFSIFI